MKTFVLVLSLAFVSGCAKTPPNLTPSQQTAFQADRLVRVLEVVQDTAIAANQQGFVSDADTATVIKAIGSAVTTIQAAPSGWLVTVQTGLVQLQANLTGTAQQKLGLAINLALTVVGEIQAAS